MNLFAHAGHVLVDLLYALPLFIMVGLLLAISHKSAIGADADAGE